MAQNVRERGKEGCDRKFLNRGCHLPMGRVWKREGKGDRIEGKESMSELIDSNPSRRYVHLKKFLQT